MRIFLNFLEELGPNMYIYFEFFVSVPQGYLGTGIYTVEQHLPYRSLNTLSTRFSCAYKVLVGPPRILFLGGRGFCLPQGFHESQIEIRY